MTNQQAPEAPKNSIAGYEAGWKDGYKQGAWAAQQPAAHVQQSAEIEHVAGDVSKNGAESNMSTQPATQQEAQEPWAWYVTGCSRLLDEDEAKAEARRIGGTARAMPLYTAPQPSPTAQAAESVPAGEYPAMPEPFIGVQDRPWGGHAEVIRSAIGEDGVVSCYTANQMRAYVDADRAARAPADSVTAPAGGAVVTDDMVLAALRAQYPRAYGQYLRHPANGPKTSLRTESEIDTVRRMIVAALSVAHTTPAHAADSVLEDAARWAPPKYNARQREWCVFYELETGFDPMMDDYEAGLQTFAEAAVASLHWYEDHTSDAHLRISSKAIPGGRYDAARKQGANHERP